MEMDDYIIKLSNKDRFENCTWRMIIDLREVAKAGRREKDKYNGGTFVDYPIPRAKRLLKLIKEYGSQEDLANVAHYMKINKKLSAFWKTLTEEATK